MEPPARELEESLPPEELAARYVARFDGPHGLRANSGTQTWALSIWEDRITGDPERAWPFFLAVVRLRPDNDEVLEQVWYRLRLLLRHHGSAFHDRVVNLVKGNSRLQRIAPAKELEAGAFRPKPLDIPVLIRDYLTNHEHHEDARELDQLIRDDPDVALTLALEIISRGPLHGFTSFDTMSPLHELLKRHGRVLIDRVEAAAAESVLVRRCLWRMRRGQSDPPDPYDIPRRVWERAERAIAGTTDYNTDDPPGKAHSLPPEYERVIESWFVYQETFWAWERIHDVVDNDPELGWRIVLLLVESAPSDAALEAVAAGPLEGLLTQHGEHFVDRVEEMARRDERFRECLGGVWLHRRDLSPDVLQRLVEASGDRILVSDAILDEDEWLRVQRASAEEYLSRQGLKHGGVAEEPTWSVELWVALWSARSSRSPESVAWWVITGDVPTDHVSLDEAPDAVAALRVFSRRLTETGGFVPAEQGQQELPPEYWLDIARMLRAQAAMLGGVEEDEDEDAR